MVQASSIALLAACSTTTPDGIDYTDFRAAPRQIIRVERNVETHTLALDPRTGQVAPVERARLEAFVKDVAQNRPDSLRVGISGAGSAEQLQRVAALLVGTGIAREKIQIEAGQQAASAGQSVTVRVERAVAVAPECPGWVDHPAAPHDNKVEPNIGCSDVNNLARMIADPNDLVTGRSSASFDGERAAQAVGAYRDDKVKELPRRRNTFDVIVPSGK